MYLALTDEQAFLSEAAIGTLERRPTLAAARAALDGEPAPELWDVAAEAGWPGLLDAEEVEGAQLGAFEAALVLEACGGRLADARMLGHLPATLLLEYGGADAGLRAALARGERRAALVDGELTTVGRSLAAGEEVVVDGVLDGPGADVLVVVAEGGQVVLVEDPDVEQQPCYDATRRLGRVRVLPGEGTPLDVPAASATAGRDMQRLLLAAESLGVADACLAMARAYAIDRHAFGRPIGSYQAIKHKLVEMLRRVESARSLVAHAGDVFTEDPASFPLAANAARVVAAGAADYCAPENIFIHGGVGATWEHDASLYYRRAEVSRRLAGGVDAAAVTVAACLLDEA